MKASRDACSLYTVRILDLPWHPRFPFDRSYAEPIAHRFPSFIKEKSFYGKQDGLNNPRALTWAILCFFNKDEAVLCARQLLGATIQIGLPKIKTHQSHKIQVLERIRSPEKDLEAAIVAIQKLHHAETTQKSPTVPTFLQAPSTSSIPLPVLPGHRKCSLPSLDSLRSFDSSNEDKNNANGTAAAKGSNLLEGQPSIERKRSAQVVMQGGMALPVPSMDLLADVSAKKARVAATTTVAIDTSIIATTNAAAVGNENAAPINRKKPPLPLPPAVQAPKLESKKVQEKKTWESPPQQQQQQKRKRSRPKRVDVLETQAAAKAIATEEEPSHHHPTTTASAAATIAESIRLKTREFLAQSLLKSEDIFDDRSNVHTALENIEDSDETSVPFSPEIQGQFSATSYIQHVALTIEHAIYCAFATQKDQYNKKVMQLKHNLLDNRDLAKGVLLGHIFPSRLILMTREELLRKDLAQREQEIRDLNMQQTIISEKDGREQALAALQYKVWQRGKAASPTTMLLYEGAIDTGFMSASQDAQGGSQEGRMYGSQHLGHEVLQQGRIGTPGALSTAGVGAGTGGEHNRVIVSFILQDDGTVTVQLRVQEDSARLYTMSASSIRYSDAMTMDDIARLNGCTEHFNNDDDNDNHDHHDHHNDNSGMDDVDEEAAMEDRGRVMEITGADEQGAASTLHKPVVGSSSSDVRSAVDVTATTLGAPALHALLLHPNVLHRPSSALGWEWPIVPHPAQQRSTPAGDPRSMAWLTHQKDAFWSGVLVHEDGNAVHAEAYGLRIPGSSFAMDDKLVLPHTLLLSKGMSMNALEHAFEEYGYSPKSLAHFWLIGDSLPRAAAHHRHHQDKQQQAPEVQGDNGIGDDGQRQLNRGGDGDGPHPNGDSSQNIVARMLMNAKGVPLRSQADGWSTECPHGWEIFIVVRDCIALWAASSTLKMRCPIATMVHGFTYSFNSIHR